VKGLNEEWSGTVMYPRMVIGCMLALPNTLSMGSGKDGSSSHNSSI